jgi:hypothetical protein
MKKTVLILFIAFSTLDLFSQVEKRNFIISVDGNYLKTTTENGVTTNQNVAQIQNLGIGASVGYFITDRFIAGVGLDYYWEKESRTNKLMFNKFKQIEVLRTKSNVYLPNFYLGYYYPIISKLYISTNLKLSLGKIKSDYKSLIAGSAYNPTESSELIEYPLSSEYVNAYEENADADYLRANLFPELTYFATSNVGLCLGLGGIEYSMTDWKTDNSSWVINFNPEYWRFGIKLKI